MAVSENLTEQDLAIIETLDNGTYNQRKIAEEVGLSLGMVNLLIKKLVQKGYVKIKRVNKRRFFYYLTPAAIEEKTKKTYRFIKRTVKTLGMMKAKIREEILRKYDEGCVSFNIVRRSDLTDIAVIVLMDLHKRFPEIHFEQSDTLSEEEGVCNIVDTEHPAPECGNCLNLVELLVKHD